MISMTQNESEKLLQMNVLLGNLEKEEVKTALALFGYTEARLNEGRVLYYEALASLEKQKAAKAAQCQSTRILTEAIANGKRIYSNHIKIARRALAGSIDSVKDLAVYGSIPRRFDMWLKNARNFYTTAGNSPTILASMSTFGMTLAQIQAGMSMIAELEGLYTIQCNNKGLYQVSTLEKKEKMDNMSRWYWDCIQMARIAFQDSPQNLERFNIVKYTPGYHPKKKEPVPVPPVPTPTTNPNH